MNKQCRLAFSLLLGCASLILGQAQGRVIWSFETGGTVFSTPVVTSDTIYFGSQDHSFYALTLGGAKKWSVITAGPILSSPAIGVDGTIYFGTAENSVQNVNHFYALRPENGGVKWLDRIGDRQCYSSPAVSLDGIVYVATLQDGLLRGYSAANGARTMNFPLGTVSISSPAIGHDGTIYVGTQGPQVWAVQANGQARWRFTTQGEVNSSPTLAADGAVYVTSFDGNLYAINPDGSRRWTFAGGAAIKSSPAIGRDGTIYFGDFDGFLFAVRPDGTLRWKYKSTGQIQSSPAVSSDGYIYFAANDFVTDVGSIGRVFALNPNGGKAWDLALPDIVTCSPAIGPDGTIYLGCFDGRLYAIDYPGSFGPVESAWPMFRRSFNHAAQLPGTIRITSPRPGQVFTVPATTPFEVEVETMPGASAKSILFHTNDTPVAFAPATAPYRVPLNLVATNTYTLTAHLVILMPDGSEQRMISQPLNIRGIGKNTPPTISANPPPSIGIPSTIDFVVGDAESPVDQLTVTVTSATPSLVDPRDIVLSTSGSNRVMTITKANAGQAQITLTVSDGVDSTSRTVQFTIIAGNTPPEILILPPSVVNSQEDEVVGPVEFGIDDRDPEDSLDKLTVTARSSNQDIVPDENIRFEKTDPTFFKRSFTVTPATNRFGTVAIVLTVRDTRGATDSKSITLNIAPVDDLPVVTPIPPQIIQQNRSSSAIPLIIRDVDSDLSRIQIVSRSSDQALIPDANIVVDGSGGDRQITITPVANKTGTNAITILILGGISRLAEASVTFPVTVLPNAQPPAIATIPAQVTERDKPLGVGFTVSDPDTALNLLTLRAESSNPSLLPVANIEIRGTNSTGGTRSLNLVPVAGQTGFSIIKITVSDPAGGSASASFVLTVNAPANQKPTISAIPDQTTQVGTPITVSFNIGDAETPVDQLLIGAEAADKTLIGTIQVGPERGATRTITLTPAPGKTGSTIISVQVSDLVESRLTTFTITVSGVANQSPVITGPSIALSSVEDTPFSIASIKVADPDGGTSVEQLSLAVTNGTLTLASTTGINVTAGANSTASMVITGTLLSLNTAISNLVYLAQPNYAGPDSLALVLNDLGNGTPAAARSFATNFSLSIAAVNDAPSISNLAADQTIDGDTDGQPLTFTIADVDNLPASLSMTAISDNRTLIPDANITFGGSDATRSVTAKPVSGQGGSARITITVTDTGGLTATASYLLNVRAVNRSPVITLAAGTVTVDEDSSLLLTGITLSDPDAGPAVVRLSLSVTNGSLRFGITNGITFTTGTNGGTNLVITGSLASLNAGIASLIYRPEADYFGPDRLTLVLDDLGNTGPGGARAATNSLALTVQAVNDPPTMNVPGAEALPEDSAPQTKQILGLSSGAANEVQTLTLRATSDRPDLVPDPVIVYTSPATSAVLTYSPRPDAAGLATITVFLSDGETTVSNKFVISLQEINDPPFFTQGKNVTVSQDSGPFVEAVWARNISAGPPSEARQKVSFVLTPVNPALFSVAPAIDSTGNLTFTPAPGASGSTDVRMLLTDDGDLSSGGPKSFLPAPSFNITIIKVAASPVITLNGDPFTLREDQASPPIPFTIIDPDTPQASLQISALSSQPGVVPNTPGALVIRNVGGNNYTLVITPAANAFGNAVITLTAGDESNTSQRDFTVKVDASNDAPAFTKGKDVTVREDAGPQVITGWATGISPGPVDEALQTLSFAVTNDAPALFVTQPAISPEGDLTFTTAPNAFGLATVTIELQDNGGVANGGADTSAPQTFTITVTPVNDPPQLGTVNDYGPDEDGPPVRVTLVGINSGAPNEIQNLTITAKSSNPAVLPDPVIVYRSPDTNAFLTFQANPNFSGVTVEITVTISDSGGVADGGEDTAIQKFSITMLAVNDAPTISAIPNQTINQDATTGPLAFILDDVDSPVTQLILGRHSSNAALVADSGIVFGGQGGNRTVTVTPLAGQSGQAIISIIVSDGELTATNQFTLTVRRVDGPPVISVVADQVMDEDRASAPVTFTVADVDTAPIALSVTASSSDPGLVPSSGLVLSGVGTTNYSLVITPARDRSGTNTITLAVSDGASTNTTQFLLTVRPVNDAPAFVKGGDQSAKEDSGLQTVSKWATGLATGPADESAQTLQFAVTNDNPSLFITQPSVNPAGDLTFAPAPNAFGVAQVTVQLRDDGGVARGGIDTAAPQTFAIAVMPVNDAPTFTKGIDQTVNEDAGPQSIPNWAINITPGPANETAQQVVFTLTNDNPSLFSVPPALSPAGTLAFTPAPNAAGIARMTARLADDGGTANGGADTSPGQTFTITVQAVNDPPSFTKGFDQTVKEDAGPQSIPNWATSLSAGPADEAGQTLAFQVTTVNSGLFSVAPSISPAGTLTFTPAPDAFGSATITVQLKDNGGVVNGGRDSSPSQSFVIQLDPVNDAPTIGKLNTLTLEEDANPLNVVVGGISAGAANEIQRLTVTAVSSDPAIVPNPQVTYTSPESTAVLRIVPAPNATGTVTITVTVRDDGGTLNGGLDTVTQTVVVTVGAVNDPPTISRITDQQIDQGGSTGALPFVVGDPDTAIASLTVTARSSALSLVPSNAIQLAGQGANRTVTVTPLAGQFGEADISLVVSDGSLSATNTFKLTVRQVLRQPGIGVLEDKTIDEDTQLGPVAIVLTDPDTPLTSLTLLVRSSNQTLVPDVNLRLSGAGGNRALIVTPVTNQFGVTTISLVVSDGTQSATNSFTLTVRSVNDAPTISALTNQSTPYLTPTAALPFIIGDVDTPLANLSVAATASDPFLLPDGALLLGGQGANRTLTIRPAVCETGVAEVTVTVSDGTLNARSVFHLTVQSPQGSPVLTSIPVQTTKAGQSLRLGVAVVSIYGQACSDAVTLQATSGNLRLVPAAGLITSGSGTNRLLTINPAAGESGSVSITLVAKDIGGGATTNRFDLIVTPLNSAPTISFIPDQDMSEDDPAKVVSVDLADAETPVDQLVVTVVSSNQALVPNTNLVLDQAGARRGLTITLLANQSGDTTITLKASDGVLEATRSFVLTVAPVNDPPVLTTIRDQFTNQDTALDVAVSASDIDTLPAAWGWSVTTSDAGIVPASGARFSGSGTNRVLTLQPAAGRTGVVTVNVTVNDGQATATTAFKLTVVAPNTPPAITAQPLGRNVLVGTTVELGVGVTGTAPLRFQWRMNGTNLPGATNVALVLNNIQTANSGRYSVVVSNTVGSVTSTEAVVLVGRLGAKLWDFLTAREVRSSAAIGPDGAIYVGSDDGRLYAFNPNGFKKWDFAAGASIGSSPAIGPDGTIYFGAQNGQLIALTPQGVKKWSYNAGGVIDSSPALASDGTIYVGSQDNNLHAVSPLGIRKWVFATGGLIYSSPAVGGDGTIYFGSYDNRFYAVNTNGIKKWDFLTGGVVATSPALGADGTIYFGSADRRLYAMRPEGTVKWQFTAANAVNSSPVLAPDGTIYFGSDDGKLYAVNPTGTKRWDFTTGGPVYSSPAVGDDGTIYFGSFDTKLYALNANGTKRWEYATTSAVYSSPVVDADGVVYLGSFDNRFYAIKGTTGLAGGAWPMFHRDLPHTGRGPATQAKPPELDSPVVLVDGALELAFTGEAGRGYVIEYSADLVTWIRLATVTGVAPVTRYVDRSNNGFALRFYRVSVP